MKRALSEEQVQEVCQRYLAGESAHSIAQDFNVWATTVCDWLRRMDIPIRAANHNAMSEELMDTICEVHRSGKTVKEIVDLCKVNKEKVYKALRRHNTVLNKPTVGRLSYETTRTIIEKREQGVSSRALAREYGVSKTTILTLPKISDPDALTRYYDSIKHCNDDFFSDILDPLKLYWFGFIAADGCLTNTNVLSVSLQLRDADHLERLGEAMESTFPVHKYTYPDRSFCILQIRSPRIVADLTELGLEPRKTETLCWPHLPMWAFRHYLRGYSDGDGCFCDKTRSLAYTLIGNGRFLEAARNHLAAACQLNPLALTPVSPSNRVFTFRFVGNKQCLRIANYLYEGATVYLPRKRDLVLRHYESLPKYRDQLRFG